MLYRLGNRVWVENTAGVIEGPESLIVIDPGYKKEVVSDINDLCITLRKPVKDIMYTHLHNDHTLNGGYFKSANHLAPPSFKTEKDSVPINIAGVPMNVYKTPGHCSTGDISVLVDDLLFTGDMINRSHIPVVRDHEAYFASLAKIAAIDFKKAYSAHSGIFSREEALKSVDKMSFFIKRGRELVAAFGPVLEGKAYLDVYFSLMREAGFSKKNIEEKLSSRDSNNMTHYDYFRELFDVLSKTILIL